MPLVSETFPSRFLKAVDLKGREHHVRIISVEQQVIGDPPKTVLVASFANRSKSWVLNKTNSYALAAASRSPAFRHRPRRSRFARLAQEAEGGCCRLSAA